MTGHAYIHLNATVEAAEYRQSTLARPVRRKGSTGKKEAQLSLLMCQVNADLLPLIRG